VYQVSRVLGFTCCSILYDNILVVHRIWDLWYIEVFIELQHTTLVILGYSTLSTFQCITVYINIQRNSSFPVCFGYSEVHTHIMYMCIYSENIVRLCYYTIQCHLVVLYTLYGIYKHTASP
jgi:hypothetical protein